MFNKIIANLKVVPFSENPKNEPNRLRYLHNLISILIFDEAIQAEYATSLRVCLNDLSQRDPNGTSYFQSESFKTLRDLVSRLERDINELTAKATEGSGENLHSVSELIKLVAKPPKSTPNKPVDLMGLAEQVVASFQPAYTHLKFEIVCDKTIEVNSFYTFNYQFMRDVITNFVSNAVRFAKSKIHIELGYCHEKEDLTVKVFDDGVDITKPSDLFKKRESLHPAAGSSGIGLHTLVEPAQQQGIHLEYSTEPSKHFSVRTPVHKVEQVPNVEHIGEDTEKKVIVFVDDNAIVRHVINLAVLKPNAEKHNFDYVIVPSTTRASRLITRYLEEGRTIAAVYSDNQIDEATSQPGDMMLANIKSKSPLTKRRSTSSAPDEGTRRKSIPALAPTDYPGLLADILNALSI